MLARAPHFQAFCPRCGSVVRVPEDLSAQTFARVVAERRAGHLGQALSTLLGTNADALLAAKSLVMHLTRESGRCHRCRKPLPFAGAAGECPTCRCVNLDFAAEPPASDSRQA